MDIILIAPIKYALDCPALKSVANAVGKISVIAIPMTISAMVYSNPYLIPSLILFLLRIP